MRVIRALEHASYRCSRKVLKQKSRARFRVPDVERKNSAGRSPRVLPAANDDSITCWDDIIRQDNYDGSVYHREASRRRMIGKQKGKQDPILKISGADCYARGGIYPQPALRTRKVKTRRKSRTNYHWLCLPLAVVVLFRHPSNLCLTQNLRNSVGASIQSVLRPRFCIIDLYTNSSCRRHEALLFVSRTLLYDNGRSLKTCRCIGFPTWEVSMPERSTNIFGRCPLHPSTGNWKLLILKEFVKIYFPFSIQYAEPRSL